MFTYRVQVGRVFGSWLQSATRFRTADEAQAHIDELTRLERYAGASTHIRRVVAL
jgi:hypothetical protein